MNQTGRVSAKIIPFPARRWPPARGTKPTEAATELRVQQIPACDYGSGWYHDAAIQDGVRDGKS